MPVYKAPQRDMQFVLHEMLEVEENYQQFPKYADQFNRDLINQYLEAAADFCENEIAPINQSGDHEGCHLDQGVVTTPKGFKEAYQKYVELGFTSLTADPVYGGRACLLCCGSLFLKCYARRTGRGQCIRDFHMVRCGHWSIMELNNKSKLF